MQSIVFAVVCSLAFANAGLTSVVQTVPVVQTVHAPVVHTVQTHAVHAVHTPVVHAVQTPVVHTVQTHAVHTAPLYKTAVIPTAYATAYKYRSAPAKIAVAHPVDVAPQPLYKTIVPTSYASSYSYRVPPAKLVAPVVHKTVVSTPVVHQTVVASPIHAVHTPLVHSVHPVVHHGPTVLVH